MPKSDQLESHRSVECMGSAPWCGGCACKGTNACHEHEGSTRHTARLLAAILKALGSRRV